MCTCVERQWNGKELVDIAVGTLLEDPETKSIGVAAGDFDGDGQEEVKSNQHLGFMQHKFIPCCVVDVCLCVLQLYVLNTDTFLGRKKVTDRLFDSQSGQ